MSNNHKPEAPASPDALAAAYYANPAQRLSFVRGMFNRTARHYDSANLVFSLGSGGFYRRACLRWAGLRPGMQAVDVAVGTGLLAGEILAITGDPGAVIGVDVSEAMLGIARNKLGIPLVLAAAEALPLPPASADFVAMGYALRHIADIQAALREALRVLRPGGTILLLEISAPRRKWARGAAAFYIGRVVPLLSLLTARNRKARTLMRYHWDTILNYMPPDAVQAAMSGSGFTNVDCWSELGLFHCFVGNKAPASGVMAPLARSKSARMNFFPEKLPVSQTKG
jgi:demethylmenaquinone methyltransferase/2-methoxy-6-polyprenyl-1,4-benzoquinol methylase